MARLTSPGEGSWRNMNQDRIRLFIHLASSVFSKSVAIFYVHLSPMPYIGSYHGFVESDVNKLRSLAQSLILGRPRLRWDLAPRVRIDLRISFRLDPTVRQSTKKNQSSMFDSSAFSIASAVSCPPSYLFQAYP